MLELFFLFLISYVRSITAYAVEENDWKKDQKIQGSLYFEYIRNYWRFFENNLCEGIVGGCIKLLNDGLALSCVKKILECLFTTKQRNAQSHMLSINVRVALLQDCGQIVSLNVRILLYFQRITMVKIS